MAEINNNILNACMKNPIGVEYFPIPNYTNQINNQYSIIDALKSVGYPSDKDYRLKIGKRNNLPGIPFSPEYKTLMLNLMK